MKVLHCNCLRSSEDDIEHQFISKIIKASVPDATVDLARSAEEILERAAAYDLIILYFANNVSWNHPPFPLPRHSPLENVAVLLCHLKRVNAPPAWAIYPGGVEDSADLMLQTVADKWIRAPFKIEAFQEALMQLAIDEFL